MNVVQIITALLPIFAQAAPLLVRDIANLIHGNPQDPNETDDAYIARIGSLVDANVKKIIDEDADIQKG